MAEVDLVDTSKVEAATQALRDLAQAATEAKIALLDLGIVLTADLMAEDQDEPGPQRDQLTTAGASMVGKRRQSSCNHA